MGTEKRVKTEFEATVEVSELGRPSQWPVARNVRVNSSAATSRVSHATAPDWSRESEE